MAEPNKKWTGKELYDLSQRRKDLYPQGLEYSEGGWWVDRGPKHDMGVGPHLVQSQMLKEANRILGLTGNAEFTDLCAAIAELDAKRPYRW